MCAHGLNRVAHKKVCSFLTLLMNVFLLKPKTEKERIKER